MSKMKQVKAGKKAEAEVKDESRFQVEVEVKG
jgi:hypothetical protein